MTAATRRLIRSTVGAPWRTVTAVRLLGRRIKSNRYDLTLDCGHTVRRWVPTYTMPPIRARCVPCRVTP